jgi:hypothetical protein
MKDAITRILRFGRPSRAIARQPALAEAAD